jgi:Icc-related predicted phosphoesterase
VSRAGLTLRAGLPVRAPWPDGAFNADCRVADVTSLRVAGLGGCRRYSAGPNQYTDAQFWRRAARLRAAARWRGLRDHRRVDVVITHAPPRDVGDDDDPAHRGFSALHGLVAALRPAVLLHGHTSPSGARDQPGQLGGTLVRNVTGWHLLEITPGTGLTDPRGEPLRGPHAGSCRDAR